MNINPVNNTNFKALECMNTYPLKKAINNRTPEVQAALKNAAKQLEKTKTKLTVDFADDILVHYVDLGERSLAFIDNAVAEDNILKVCGYTYDKNGSKLKNTRYVAIDIPLKNSKTAKNLANAFNCVEYNDPSANSLAKAALAAKAFDLRI